MSSSEDECKETTEFDNTTINRRLVSSYVEEADLGMIRNRWIFSLQSAVRAEYHLTLCTSTRRERTVLEGIIRNLIGTIRPHFTEDDWHSEYKNARQEAGFSN